MDHGTHTSGRVRAGHGFLICGLALIALGGLAYSNSLGGPFVLDDVLSIRDNPHIRVLWPPSHWLSLEPQSSLSGRPLVTLSMALCHAVGGLDVRVYHGVNVVLHLINAVLLLGLLRVHLGTRAAFAAALLWTVHPLNTEAVDYLTQRTELLLGSFYLGALFALARGLRGVAVLCCGLGMLCKESMVTAPVALLLWERVYRFGSWRELLAQQRVFCFSLAATWGILLAVLLLEPRSQSVGFSLDVSALDYALNQLVAIARYLELAVWPNPLAVYYGHVRAIGIGDAILPGLVVLAAVAAALALLWRAPRAGYPAVLFFLLLAPTSSIVPIATEVAAERRMYLPLAALVALAVGFTLGRKRVHVAGWVGIGALAAALGVTTWVRNTDYASEVSLWQSSVEALPDVSQGFVNLGIAHAEVGEYAEAADAYRRALLLAPDDARAHYDLALALQQLGEIGPAISEFERAVALEPRFHAAQLALARMRAGQGDAAESRTTLRRALESLPDSVVLKIELAQSLLESGDPRAIAEALELAREASAASEGRDPAALHTLAAAEWASGLREQAVLTQARALELAARVAPGLEERLAEQLARYRAALSSR